MDLRNLPDSLSPLQRINQRRTLIETEHSINLSLVSPSGDVIGEAEQKNCEQMFGVVSVPVGYAGPLSIKFSNGTTQSIGLPLATTEGALVASVNRGAKASGTIEITKAQHHGITRSIAFEGDQTTIIELLRDQEAEWKRVAEATSGHLKILGYDLDVAKKEVFLTIRGDADEAMGMNMITIAAQAIADWAEGKNSGIHCVTIAGNVDSDKKPSKRTHERGRGYEVTASVTLAEDVIEQVLKSSSPSMLRTAEAKLKSGSTLAGAIGKNLHAGNIIAALYIATGQDPAHVSEGALADTVVEKVPNGLKVSVRVPAIIVGVRGGGTNLPVQKQCLDLILSKKAGLHPKQQLAESIAAAVLAGEISLLAAQASGQLAKAHEKLAR
ncbi:MAG: 3-hydroxy-3-methylglutaryl-CoA reductase [Candidatus Peribacteraceae bacterium]